MGGADHDGFSHIPFGIEVGLSRRRFMVASLTTLLPTLLCHTGKAADTPSAVTPRSIPARVVPVPDTVSPELQARIAAPYPSDWNVIPEAASAWRDLATRSAAEVVPHLAAIRQKLNIDVRSAQISGVPVFVVAPADMPPSNRDRLLLHVHGGGYVLYPGEAGAGEAMLMAGYGRFRVVSVDYRMAPDFPFPAALDDAMAVWRALLRDHDPRKMAIFGSSAGGGLTMAMILKAKAEGLPLPAAIAPGTPWVDLTGAGDSIMANAYIDNVLVAGSGWVGAAAALYAGGHDRRDPLLSPIFGDFSGFPPAILTSGTRDLFLSNTIRAHRKLRRAGVEASLQIFEGQSHAQFLDLFVPETEEAFGEIALFLARHLDS